MIVDACPNVYLRQNYALIQTQSERFRFMTGNISNNRLEDTFRETHRHHYPLPAKRLGYCGRKAVVSSG